MQGLFHGREVQGIDRLDVPDPQGPDQGFKLQGRGRLPLKGGAAAGVFLVAGHAGGAVV